RARRQDGRTTAGKPCCDHESLLRPAWLFVQKVSVTPARTVDAGRSASVQFLFGDCMLDLDRRELTRGPQAVSVGPQGFDLLVYLVQNREKVVSKDELLDSVWGGRIVSESTLTSHINAVRKAIGDRGEEQRLIKTVPRRGFRFIGDVREARAPDEPDAPD